MNSRGVEAPFPFYAEFFFPAECYNLNRVRVVLLLLKWASAVLLVATATGTGSLRLRRLLLLLSHRVHLGPDSGPISGDLLSLHCLTPMGSVRVLCSPS